MSGSAVLPNPDTLNDPAAALQQLFDRKVEALTPILTGEQLKSYRELQAKQLQVIQAFLPKGAASVPPPPPVKQSP